MTANDIYTVAGSCAGHLREHRERHAPAPGALLDDPVGISVDSNGDCIVADTGNNVVAVSPRPAVRSTGHLDDANEIYDDCGVARPGTSGYGRGDDGGAVGHFGARRTP